jgi:hypothetical protein
MICLDPVSLAPLYVYVYGRNHRSTACAADARDVVRRTDSGEPFHDQRFAGGLLDNVKSSFPIQLAAPHHCHCHRRQ